MDHYMGRYCVEQHSRTLILWEMEKSTVVENSYYGLCSVWTMLSWLWLKNCLVTTNEFIVFMNYTCHKINFKDNVLVGKRNYLWTRFRFIFYISHTKWTQCGYERALRRCCLRGNVSDNACQVTLTFFNMGHIQHQGAKSNTQNWMIYFLSYCRKNLNIT